MSDLNIDAGESPQPVKAEGSFFPLPVISDAPKKRKKTKEDWDQMLWPLVDKANPPRATRHLNRQTMCGACQFKCCTEIFAVELSPEESERLGEPLAWRQNGRCYCLTEDAGCKFGDDRPSFCKIYPVQIDFEKKQLYHPQWAYLHCPSPKNFHFVEIDADGKYVYHANEGIKGPIKNNIQAEIHLDGPIEEWPTVLEQNAEGLAEIYSPEMVDGVREQLRILNEGEAGFDLKG